LALDAAIVHVGDASPGQASKIAAASETKPQAAKSNAFSPVEQSGVQVTFEGAIRQALSWHPSIDEAVGRLSQRTSEIDVARAGYYPKVRGGINSAYDSAY